MHGMHHRHPCVGDLVADVRTVRKFRAAGRETQTRFKTCLKHALCRIVGVHLQTTHSSKKQLYHQFENWKEATVVCFFFTFFPLLLQKLQQ